MMKILLVLAAVAATVLIAVSSFSCGGNGASGPRVRLVLAPEQTGQVGDLEAALEEAVDVIQRRVEAFDLRGSDVRREGNRIVVELPGVTRDELIDNLGRIALLQFCEPVTNSTGDVATTEGEVQYRAQTCDPVRDAGGEIVVTGGTITFVPWARADSAQSQNNPQPDQIVWQPASAEIGGQTKTLDGNYLRPNTFVSFEGVVSEPVLSFEFTEDGADIAEQVTERLVERNYPLAPFLDGEPILDSTGLPIAPRVQGTITTNGVITGLSSAEAEDLSILLNSGAFPIPLRVVEATDITE